MFTFIAHFWKRKLNLIRQQNVSTCIDQCAFLARSYVLFRHYHLTHAALIRDFFHTVCQKNWARGRTGYMIKLATTQNSRSVAQTTSVVHAQSHVEKKTLLANDTNYIFKSNKHPLDMHIGCYLGYCLPMRRAMFTKIVNSLSDEYPFNTLWKSKLKRAKLTKKMIMIYTFFTF